MFNATETDSVSSKIWIDAEMTPKLNFFIENFVSTLSIPSYSLERSEFPVWDSLSDEALLNFERELV
jgi:hypothetical protein